MASKQDQLLRFNIDFNVVLMDDEMPIAEKSPKLLQLQKGLDILPNEQSKALFKLQSNLSLGDCYVKANQKYNLTPIVEDCKVQLLKLEEHDFANQPKEVWGYLAERFEGYYGELIDLCQAKNHQRDIAYCHQQVARIWDRAGNEQNCIKAFVLSNIAFSKVPDCFAMTREQLVVQFEEHAELVEQTFAMARSLKTDPIEQSLQYIAIYDEAERIIQGIIEEQGRLPRYPDQYWKVKAEVLEFHFNIHWKNPRLMNPNVKF